MAAILANPLMIQAYLAGVPDNAEPFPDGPRRATKKNSAFIPVAVSHYFPHESAFCTGSARDPGRRQRSLAGRPLGCGRG